MRRLRPYGFCLIAVALIFCIACNRSNVKADLQGRYDGMNAAFKARNPDDWLKYVANDYQATYLGGTTQNRSQAETSLKDGFKTIVEVDSKTTVDNASLSGGDRADATATTVQKGSIRDATQTQTHTFEIKSTSKDVWHLENGEWKLVQSTETSHTATRDGQPVGVPSTAKPPTGK